MITIPMTVSATNETVPMSVSGDSAVDMHLGANFAPVPDVYDGPTEVTPDTQEIVLETNGKTMPAHVTVHAMPSGSATTPESSYEETMMLTVSPSGVVSGTKAVTKAITPVVVPGYVSQGAAGNVTVNISSSVQLPTKAAEIFEPGAVAQTISENQYLTGAQIIQPWNWIGMSAEKVTSFSYSSGTVALKNTGFNGWTPSTTAKTITSSATAGTFTSDFANYEYVLKWSFKFQAAYNTGATLKNQTNKQTIEIYQTLCKRPSSLVNIGSATFTGNACITYQTVPLIIYYGSTTGSLTFSYTGSYGIYAAATAATFANSTADATTVTIKTPAVSARCSTTYMATARASELDQEHSVYTITGELYRYKKNGALEQMYRSLIDFHNA